MARRETHHDLLVEVRNRSAHPAWYRGGVGPLDVHYSYWVEQSPDQEQEVGIIGGNYTTERSKLYRLSGGESVSFAVPVDKSVTAAAVSVEATSRRGGQLVQIWSEESVLP